MKCAEHFYDDTVTARPPLKASSGWFVAVSYADVDYYVNAERADRAESFARALLAAVHAAREAAGGAPEIPESTDDALMEPVEVTSDV